MTKRDKSKYRRELLPAVDIYEGEEPHIFISYSHADKLLVYFEIERLHKLYRIWYDEGIEPGDEISKDLTEAIENSSFFIEVKKGTDQLRVTEFFHHE